MDERIRKRRRSVRWERGRGRRAALFLVALALCCVGAFLWLRSTDVFAVMRVEATGAQQVTREQLAAVTSGVMGKSMLSISTSPIREGLMELPYVESVVVRRSFPNTLEIRVVEYAPVARLRTEEGAEWLVSDDGTVLEGAYGSEFTGLPLLVPDASLAVQVGSRVPGVVADVLPLAALVRSESLWAELPELSEIAVSAAGCAALVLADGVELRLGAPEALEQKLGISLGIVKQFVAEGKAIEYVDASVVDRVAVKPK